MAGLLGLALHDHQRGQPAIAQDPRLPLQGHQCDPCAIAGHCRSADLAGGAMQYPPAAGPDGEQRATIGAQHQQQAVLRRVRVADQADRSVAGRHDRLEFLKAVGRASVQHPVSQRAVAAGQTACQFEGDGATPLALLDQVAQQHDRRARPQRQLQDEVLLAVAMQAQHPQFASDMGGVDRVFGIALRQRHHLPGDLAALRNPLPLVGIARPGHQPAVLVPQQEPLWLAAAVEPHAWTQPHLAGCGAEALPAGFDGAVHAIEIPERGLLPESDDAAHVLVLRRQAQRLTALRPLVVARRRPFGDVGGLHLHHRAAVAVCQQQRHMAAVRAEQRRVAQRKLALDHVVCGVGLGGALRVGEVPKQQLPGGHAGRHRQQAAAGALARLQHHLQMRIGCRRDAGLVVEWRHTHRLRADPPALAGGRGRACPLRGPGLRVLRDGRLEGAALQQLLQPGRAVGVVQVAGQMRQTPDKARIGGLRTACQQDPQRDLCQTRRAPLRRTGIEDRHQTRIVRAGLHAGHQEQVLGMRGAAQEFLWQCVGQCPLAQQQVVVAAAPTQVVDTVRFAVAIAAAQAVAAEQGVQTQQPGAELGGDFRVEPVQPQPPGLERGGHLQRGAHAASQR
ncbi:MULTISPECIES: DUF732 domain-containing protein [Xanthomonas]|uniref:DUF732 domain-containing protein n=1 Tax=Xanthomonas TaxID=338 RepID=UPI003D181713